MNYSRLRLRLNIWKKGINLLIVICMALIIGLAKPNQVTSNVKLIAKPFFKPFFDQFKDTGRNFTNIFNL